MGCDIHVLVEVKYSGKPWELWFKNPHDRYPDPHYYGNDELDCISGRSYEFFGILAGVRGGSTPIAAHRGLPKDASEYVKTWDKMNEYHSVTWCTLPEMELAVKRYHRSLWDRNTDDMGNMISLLDHISLEREKDKNQSAYIHPPIFDRTYDTVTAEPIRRAYDLLVGEHLMLGIPKPRVRFIIGFDS
jgi:hypothetical protein